MQHRAPPEIGRSNQLQHLVGDIIRLKQATRFLHFLEPVKFWEMLGLPSEARLTGTGFCIGAWRMSVRCWAG